MTPASTTSAPQGKYADVNGLKMYYEEYGSGQPLILLHGGTVTSSMWQPHVPLFAEHFRVMTPDSRGHGRTNNPTGTFSYRLMAEDVVALNRALGLRNPLVCGYSDGGQIALEIGMRYPDLPAALVVGAAWYKFSEVYLNALRAIGFEGPGIVHIGEVQRAHPDWVEAMRMDHWRADDPEYWRTLLEQISTMWWTPLDYTAKNFQDIACPTLILMGDRDGMIPITQAVEMYQLIQEAELAILPNATHRSAVSESSMKVILGFLLRHSSPAVHQ